MRHLIILPLLFLIFSTGLAQSEDEIAVRQVVDQVFTGMEKSDSAAVADAFAEEVTMVTVLRDKTGQPVLYRESGLDGFLKAIASPKKEVWHEEIWNVKINIDGDLASVWCDYAFYAGKTFSHCGADAFMLHKTDKGWKIFTIADTRRKNDCAIPAEIRKKYE